MISCPLRSELEPWERWSWKNELDLYFSCRTSHSPLDSVCKGSENLWRESFLSDHRGSFFGLASWFFSIYFLQGILFLMGGAILDFLIKIAGANLRRERSCSLLYNLMLLMNSWASIITSLVYGAALFHQYHHSLQEGGQSI